MQRIGTVRSADAKRAVVAVPRISACEGCHKANPGMETGGEGACHECMLFPADPEMTVEADNAAGAAAGDRVLLESSSRTVLFYAAAVFLGPMAAALLLGLLVYHFFSFAWAAFGGALAGFAGGFLLLRLFLEPYAKQKTTFTVVRILSGSRNGDSIQK